MVANGVRRWPRAGDRPFLPAPDIQAGASRSTEVHQAEEGPGCQDYYFRKRSARAVCCFTISSHPIRRSSAVFPSIEVQRLLSWLRNRATLPLVVQSSMASKEEPRRAE